MELPWTSFVAPRARLVRADLMRTERAYFFSPAHGPFAAARAARADASMPGVRFSETAQRALAMLGEGAWTDRHAAAVMRMGSRNVVALVAADVAGAFEPAVDAAAALVRVDDEASVFFIQADALHASAPPCAGPSAQTLAIGAVSAVLALYLFFRVLSLMLPGGGIFA
jgi:hypothetical protein